MIEDGFEYGYSEHAETLWCIRKLDANQTLCGREVGFFPVLQPADPDPICRECSKVLNPPKSKTGTCPACRGDAPVGRGRILAHDDQGVPCVGVNMRPDRWAR